MMTSSHPWTALILTLFLLITTACGGSTGEGAVEPTGDDTSHTEGTGDADEDEDWLEGDWDDDAPEGGTEYRGSAIEHLGVSPPPTPWAEMSAQDREFYMIGRVLPITHELFSNHDASRYGEAFTCTTCHGENGEEEGYEMPTASIMRLGEPGSPAWGGMEATMADTVRFMREEVTPTMGTLLGAEEGTYSCFHCHMRQGQ